ncbi:hypothetical protein COY90_04035 [Candidatus Roizmanbacteria bacterium CG_4_10_14_0_8_um_filter_39_9]|uniref:Aminoglycoside phosphotransferase domain-containing protein n=1 Tax=Candidatus Roizmanbacteria bacterium CG_4_10_14_0_8_um_filter_39_9 TaxID=1974829 RepID=A0A2M7QD54_9BACT|nr:MAG: hypothetical protein COY90_04035 [Candidatus Roizmanbacteria bacterium CG_4_10_14_0_8_um_filter_39_9]
MNKNIFLQSVKPTHTLPKFPEKTSLGMQENLEKELQKRGLSIAIKNKLKGGVFSQVYDAIIDGKSVVVKHTENVVPFDPTEFFISKKAHLVDTKILKLLKKSKHIKVPHVFYYYPDITTTIMEDVRNSGFQLLNNFIVEKNLPLSSAKSIGKSLALLAKESRLWKPFATNESANQSIYERGLELRLAYPNDQKQYLFLEKEFVQHNDYWVWPDGHPKNMFVNSRGDVTFIDFGRSHWGDQRYMLPNFLAHIVIYSLAGYIKPQQAQEYLQDCINAYKQIEPIGEFIFCQYLAMEVLHRANGKWIQGVETIEQKLNLHRFALHIFDSNIVSIPQLIRTISIV